MLGRRGWRLGGALGLGVGELATGPCLLLFLSLPELMLFFTGLWLRSNCDLNLGSWWPRKCFQKGGMASMFPAAQLGEEA